MAEGRVDFAGLLRQLRDRAGLTQEELAHRARIGVTTVGDLERGCHRTCQPKTAQRLADALAVTGPDREQFFSAARGLAVAGPAAPAQPEAAQPPVGVRYSLPPDTAAFTGRDAELEHITMVSAGAAAVCVIEGMPGVGKTALAVHVALQLRDRFADRQLFVDLHGYTPGHEPVPAGAALAGLLTTIGVDARSLPPAVEERAALWRDRMAGQRVALVLDNAASSEQVAPLLPGGPGSLVLVTSRRHLGDLPGAVVPVRVDALSPEQAQSMFMRLAPGTVAGPAVAGLVELAGFLPLAISLLARVHARHPSWTLADLTAETRASMLDLAAENTTVAAAFEVSYRCLSQDQQQFFRRLGLHPGTTIEAHAAAALTGTSLPEATAHLDVLHREALLIEASYRRYRMHDLIRRYAHNRAATDPVAERRQALRRLLDYYTHTATIAGTRLARQTRTRPLAAVASPPDLVPDLPASTQALTWARAERVNVLACLDHAAERGDLARVVALTAALASLLHHDGPWAEAIIRHTTAARAARQLDDQAGWAGALHDLGVLQRLTADYPAAAKALHEALAIYRDLGDRLGQANALSDLGALRLMTGDYPGAAQALEEALDIYRDLGDRLGQANALNYLGDVRQMTGGYPGAAQALEEALDIYRDLGDRLGQANALNYLGVVRRMTGDYPRAVQALHEALDLSCDLGHRVGQANALSDLAVVHRIAGDHARAAQDLHDAIGIYRDLGDRGGEAEALNEAGTLHRSLGDLDQATHYHRQALHLARAINSSWDEAHALAGLGRCAQACGRRADSQQLMRQAEQIFQQIGAAEATRIAAELNTVTSSTSHTADSAPITRGPSANSQRSEARS